MSAMNSAYLSILPRTMIDFLTVGTTYSTNIILFTYNTLKRGKMKIIFVLFFLKKIGDNTKKTKRLAKLQVLTKRFTKRVFKKKTQVTQLFKPINYWENAANTGSN